MPPAPRGACRGAKVLTQRLILDGVPPEPDAQAQPAAAEHVERGGLLGDHGGLALGKDKDARGKLDAQRDGGHVTEEHERFQERGLVRIRPGPAARPIRIRPQDVIIGDDVSVAGRLSRLSEIAERRLDRARTRFVGRRCRCASRPPDPARSARCGPNSIPGRREPRYELRGVVARRCASPLHDAARQEGPRASARKPALSRTTPRRWRAQAIRPGRRISATARPAWFAAAQTGRRPRPRR